MERNVNYHFDKHIHTILRLEKTFSDLNIFTQLLPHFRVNLDLLNARSAFFSQYHMSLPVPDSLLT